MTKHILVALDRDGTINVDQNNTGKDSNWKEKLELCSGACEGIKLLQSHPNIRLCVVSNQSGVFTGLFTKETLEDVNQTIHNMLKKEKVIFDTNYWYMATKVDKEYAIRKGIDLDLIDENYDWRKPKTGMLKQFSEDIKIDLKDFDQIFVIGDKIIDVQMGLNAGGKGIILKSDLKEVEKVKKIISEYDGRVFIEETLREAAMRVLREIDNLEK